MSKHHEDLVHVTRDLLLLVGLKVPLSHIRKWSDWQLEAAGNFAAKSHLAASDNPVRVPPKPGFLKNYSAPKEGAGMSRSLTAVQLLTAIRLEDPYLWEKICEFRFTSFQKEAAVSRKDNHRELLCRVARIAPTQDHNLQGQQAAFSGMYEALEAIEPFLPSELSVRRNAEVNGGEASAFHRAAQKSHQALALVRAGMELSVAGPNRERPQRLFYPVVDAANDDGRPTALNCIPESGGAGCQSR